MSEHENNDNDVEMKKCLITENQAGVASVKTVSLQTLWTDNIRGWFALAEIQFELQKVTHSKTKYLHVMSAIPANLYKTTISDVLINPPEDDHYDYIKNVLLTRLAPSEERQLEILLNTQDIGDKTPSEALRYITSLAGKNFSTTIIRSLWTRKMHELIRIALVAQAETVSLDTLAAMADRMHENILLRRNINAVEQPIANTSKVHTARASQKFHFDRLSDSIESRLDKIETALERITMQPPHMARSRSRSRSFNFRSRKPSRSRSRLFNRSLHWGTNNTNAQGMCWYHEKYKSNARKCRKPCTYKETSTDHQKNL